jgi:hypothetical protein
MYLGLSMVRCLPGEKDARKVSTCLCELLQQVVANAQGIGHDRQRRIDRAAGREEAGINDVQIVDVVGSAIRVERRGLRVVSEGEVAARSVWYVASTLTARGFQLSFSRGT